MKTNAMYSSITTQIYGDIERERERDEHVYIRFLDETHTHYTSCIFMYIYIHTALWQSASL